MGGGSTLTNKTFADKLSLATSEDKQVNPVYVEAISKGLSKLNAGMSADTPSYALYTDGVFDCYYVTDNGEKEYFILQLECKQDVDLTNSEKFAEVLIQVCYYIKQFIKNKLYVPKVVVIGTRLNCTAVPTTYLVDTYIGTKENPRFRYPTDDGQGHSISASKAPYHPLYQPLKNQMASDTRINTLSRIIGVSEKDAVKELCIDIIKVAKNLGLKEDITEETLSRAFDFFDMKVLTKQSRDNLSSRTKAEAFMQLMLNPDKVQHGVTVDVLGNQIFSGVMNFNGTVIEVEPQKFNSFANVFAVKKYSLTDQKQITAITDRLIEDTDRRRKGDFYTPTIWVDEAHKLLDKNLGDNWRNEYIVWDCAWGTGNLTRDYKFKELYCSTLHEEDIKIGSKYNVFSTKFQYDFLNDDVEVMEDVRRILWEPFRGTAYYLNKSVEKFINFKDILELYANAIANNVITQDQAQIGYVRAIDRLKHTELYEKAQDLIESLLAGTKPLLFLINPPYAASTNVKSTTLSGESKDGTNQSAVRDIMDDNKAGAASQNLYTQFIYRIDLIKKLFGNDTKLGIFCPPAYITGKNAKKLRQILSIWVVDSFLIQASQFANVSDGWGISFELLTSNNLQREYTNTIVKELGDKGIVDIGIKKLYNMDGKDNLSDWIRRNIKKYKALDAPQMKSALNWSDKHRLGNLVPGSYGYLVDSGNNIDENTSRVFWLTCCRGTGHGTSALSENILDCCSAFAARKLISGEYATWINCKDEYMIPDITHSAYSQWEIDCIVYSLFNNSSNQSSLRGIEYNEKIWNIYNEFFWLSREEIYALAQGEIKEQDINNAILEDLSNHAKQERFVYEKLQQVHLSDDAQQVLNKATEILKGTFQYREEFSSKHSEYHINTWDAGWYQIKALAKEYLPEELKAFNELYKAFSDRLRPLVYELGFLYE